MQVSSTRTRFSLDPLPIFISLMDAAWIYFFAWLFGSVILARTSIISVPHPLLLGLVEFAGVVLTAYLIRRGLNDVSLRVMMALVGLGLAVAIAFVYTPVYNSSFDIIFFVPFFYVLLLTLIVWAVGSSRGTQPDYYERAYLHFRLGLSAIVVATLFATLLSGGNIDKLWAELWGVVLLFFGSGLAALALGNRETVRLESADSGLRSWGGMLGVTVSLILVLGIVSQAFGTGGIISTIQNVVIAILTALAGLFYVISLIVIWPLSLCKIGIGDTPVAPPPARTPAPDPMEALRQLQRENQGYNPINIPVEWQTFFMVLAGLFVTGVVLYFLFRWLRISRVQQTQLFEDEHERFGSWGLLLEQLRAWIDRLLSRFRKPVSVPGLAQEDDLASLRGRAEMVGTLTIRQIYVRLLGNARKAGYPRAPQQTPSEYLRVLSNALPDIRPDLEVITSVYLEARYSPYPASTLSVNSVNEAWKHIEASGMGQTQTP